MSSQVPKNLPTIDTLANTSLSHYQVHEHIFAQDKQEYDQFNLKRGIIRSSGSYINEDRQSNHIKRRSNSVSKEYSKPNEPKMNKIEFKFETEMREKAEEKYRNDRIRDVKVRDMYLLDQMFSKKIPMALKRHNFKDKFGVRLSPYFSKTDVIINDKSFDKVKPTIKENPSTVKKKKLRKIHKLHKRISSESPPPTYCKEYTNKLQNSIVKKLHKRAISSVAKTGSLKSKRFQKDISKTPLKVNRTINETKLLTPIYKTALPARMEMTIDDRVQTGPRSKSTVKLRHRLINIANLCSEVKRKNKPIITLKKDFLIENKEIDRISSLMGRLEKLKGSDPRSFYLIYKSMHKNIEEQESDIFETREEFRNGIADPVHCKKNSHL
ncbi:unnamed protein product [Moneuplotes crassus]|uniref:Uncharacterized protein n=1 Tax=Euplotes crassus TaxID=5936 RepID=A0AAD1YB30_EUPCR|nr:unnamed protein product [Moneuplotes crassus]